MRHVLCHWVRDVMRRWTSAALHAMTQRPLAFAQTQGRTRQWALCSLWLRHVSRHVASDATTQRPIDLHTDAAQDAPCG